MIGKSREGHLGIDSKDESPRQGTHVVARNGQSARRSGNPMSNICAVQTPATETTTYDDSIARAFVATSRIGSLRAGTETLFSK